MYGYSDFFFKISDCHTCRMSNFYLNFEVSLGLDLKQNVFLNMFHNNIYSETN